jgi:hypothetical protein
MKRAFSQKVNTLVESVAFKPEKGSRLDLIALW